MVAMRDLGAYGQQGWPILQDFLNDPEPLIRETAWDALAASKDSALIPVLEAQLTDETDVDVLIAGIKALGRFAVNVGFINWNTCGPPGRGCGDCYDACLYSIEI